VADREARRLSFGAVAADYDRYRPSPPPEAVEWLLPAGATVVLDLAAGTGAVTRELVGRVPRVVAVEPDERMRAVLSVRCPEAEVLAGRGEDIPLADRSVDAVLVASAWQWLDPDQAVPEIIRVLRPGGTLGVIWTSRDTRTPWVAELNALSRGHGEADRAAGAAEEAAGGRQVTFPPGTISPVEKRTAEFTVPVTKDDLFGLLGTHSDVITLGPEDRADFSRRVREFLDRQPWDEVDLPMLCRCLRSIRLPG
jgi:SAM-dependent methyltransferase